MAKRAPTEISDALKEIVRESGMGVRELARAADIDHTILVRFLNGQSMMGLEVLNKVAAALDLRLVRADQITKRGADR